MSCPHCNGESGVTFSVRLRATRYCRWNGEEEGLDDSTITRKGALICSDCGKRVSRRQFKRGSTPETGK